MAKSKTELKPDKIKRGRKKRTLASLQEEIKSKCLSIKSIIDSGNLKALRDLEPLFSKAMADEMGVNHGRFLDKLRNPIKFSIYDLHRFANYVNIESGKLSAQINDEITCDKKLQIELSKFRSVKDLKQYQAIN